MSYSFFRERSRKPSDEEIIELIGINLKPWSEINTYMINIIKAKPTYKFYGKNYGWALGYSKSGRSVISLYPLPNDFTVQIILKKEHETDIIKILDNKELCDLIKNKPAIHEGKWVFIRYSKINSIEIVKKMVEIKLA